MRVVQLTVVPDADGQLRFSIPAGTAPAARYEAAVILTPIPHAAKSPEERGWPPGYFENVVGSIEDERFVRPPQPDLGPPVSLE